MYSKSHEFCVTMTNSLLVDMLIGVLPPDAEIIGAFRGVSGEIKITFFCPSSSYVRHEYSNPKEFEDNLEGL